MLEVYIYVKRGQKGRHPGHARIARVACARKSIRFRINALLPINRLWCIYYCGEKHSAQAANQTNMSFIEENWQYIRETAEARAVEIAVKTRCFHDVPDYMQDMFLFLCRRVSQYDPGRSMPKTFINMCLQSAKVNITKRMFRQKNILIKQAMETEYER